MAFGLSGITSTRCIWTGCFVVVGVLWSWVFERRSRMNLVLLVVLLIACFVGFFISESADDL